MSTTLPASVVPAEVATLTDQIVGQVSALLAGGSALVVETQDDYEAAGELIQRIKGAEKRLESARKELVEPLNHQVRAINAAFKEKTATLERAENLLKYGTPEGRGAEGMGGFSRRQEEKRQELQRIEDEKRRAAIRAAEEERQRILDEAAALEKSGEADVADTVELLRAQADVVPAELVAEPVEVKTMEKVSGVSTREEWIPEPIERTSFGLTALRWEAEQALRLLQVMAPHDERAKAVADRLDAALRSAVEPLYLDIKLRFATLKSIGTSMKGAHVVPGIVFRKELTVASRAK